MSKKIILLALVASFASTAAVAQQRQVMRACGPDIKRLCPNERPGEGGMRACVKQNFHQLSEGCREAIVVTMMEKRQSRQQQTQKTTQ